MSTYDCALANGLCECGNDMFDQSTIVRFTPSPEYFTDADGRFKRQAETVEKIYKCTKCRATYRKRTYDDSYVRVDG